MMKKVLKPLLSATIAGLFLVACQQIEVLPDPSGVTGSSASGQGIHIALGDLPTTITAYVQAQYPGLSIVKAEKKLNPDGSVRKYEITLSNGVKLNFDVAGQLISIGNSSSSSGSGSSSSGSGFDDSIDIPLSAVPQAALDYIAANYPGKQIQRAKKRLNDDGSIRAYELRLSDNSKVFFDAAGNFTGYDD